MNKKICKENARELQAKGVEARKENKERRERFLVDLVMGNGEAYNSMLEKLRDDQDLTKNQKEFLDRLEKNFEFVIPKRARVDEKGETVRHGIFEIEQATKILENVNGGTEHSDKKSS